MPKEEIIKLIEIFSSVGYMILSLDRVSLRDPPFIGDIELSVISVSEKIMSNEEMIELIKSLSLEGYKIILIEKIVSDDWPYLNEIVKLLIKTKKRSI